MPKDTQNETAPAPAPKRVAPKILITDMPPKPDLKIVPAQTLAEMEAGRQALAKHKR